MAMRLCFCYDSGLQLIIRSSVRRKFTAAYCRRFDGEKEPWTSRCETFRLAGFLQPYLSPGAYRSTRVPEPPLRVTGHLFASVPNINQWIKKTGVGTSIKLVSHITPCSVRTQRKKNCDLKNRHLAKKIIGARGRLSSDHPLSAANWGGK